MSSTDKKYKYTRQLLKIAKQEGNYTNKEIEKKAGLKGSSSSLASRWLNGHALATERQMRYFINNYGHLLKRQMEHLYYQYLPNGEKLVMSYVKLSGDVIFKHQIRIEPTCEYKKGLSALRVVIIENSGSYKLLLQYRAGLIQWINTMNESKVSYLPSIHDVKEIVHTDNEEAHWHLWEVNHCKNTDELIEKFEAACHTILSEGNIIDWAKCKGRINKEAESRFFRLKHVGPMKFSFYQKLMKLGLQSELLPF
ncbi:hypothetical protein L1D34_06995 [Vibrio mediterranei]|uniref:hypothetical protein n=1 Tax=Vibrio mediterranei TaxID=689 RepID=UPI001EFE06AB|nr:hypothetical protein [Vibrio mediterranei]MCG9624585.1 hypothetical protein [Vibrio mediterranei]